MTTKEFEWVPKSTEGHEGGGVKQDPLDSSMSRQGRE